MGKTNLKKQKTETEKFKNEIDLAFAYQETPWLSTSNRLIQAFKGKYYSSTASLDRYVVNTIFSLINLILPNLIFSKPFIKVKAKTPYFQRKTPTGGYEQIDNIKAAEIMESAINHVMNDIDAWEYIQMAIQDSLYYSIGYTKVGYSVETESTDDLDFIKDENPFVMRVCPKDIGYHPLATAPDNASVMVHHMVKHKDDLIENKNYKNIESLKPSLPQEMKDRLNHIKTGELKDFIRLWEVHDQKKGRILTYGGEQKKLIWKRDKPYQYKGSDFNSIKFAGDNDDFLGIPLLGMIEDEAKAINEILTMMIRHVKMFPGVVDVDESSVDSNDIERVQKQEQGSIHTWQNLNGVKRTPPMQMGGEYFNLLTMLFNIIDRVLGIPDFQRGLSTKRKTATEATFEESSSTIRREYYIQIVKKFVLKNVEKVAAIIQTEFNEERLIPIIGTTDAKFIKFSMDDIQGEYNFDFDVDTMRFINEAQVQQLINALNIMAAHPVLQPILGSFDPEAAAKEIFKRMNLNIEAFRNREQKTKLYFTPEKENLLAQQGSFVPEPKFDEDHDLHLAVHEELKGNAEMERHKAFHRAMNEQKQPQVQVGTPITNARGTQPAAQWGASRPDILSAVAGG